MKYIKHYTWQDWQKFNTPVKPSIRFEKFMNHSTGKKEPYTSLTVQEVLLSKYKIIIDNYESVSDKRKRVWSQRYAAVKKVFNQKNLDKGLSDLNKLMGAFSSGLGGSTTKPSRKPAAKPSRKPNKDTEILLGSKPKWENKPVQFFPKHKSKHRSKHRSNPKPMSVDEQFYGKKPKGKKNKTVSFYSSKNNVRVF